MSKAILYAGNSTPTTTVAAGTVIPFSTIVRRYGCNCNISGGNVTLNGIGYYNGIVNITYTGSAAGTVTVTVYKDGVAIPYANASATTAAAVINSISVPFVSKINCCCESTITVVVSGAVVDVTNASIAIEKE